MEVPSDDALRLIEEKPELMYKGGITEGEYIAGRIDRDLPFSDIRVRKALQMSIDYQSIIDDYHGGESEIIWYPTASSFPSLYIPLEEMPESVQENYQYNPEKAKQLLAEAGYPDGFQTEVIIFNDSYAIDMASLAKEYFAAIGVDMDIKVLDRAIWNSIRLSKQHDQMIYATPTFNNPFKVTHAESGSRVNNAGIDDPVINEANAAIWAYENIDKPELRADWVKKRALRVLDQAYFVTFPSFNLYVMWWPWIKNYHGELFPRGTNWFAWQYFVWADQDLKRSMGY
jgi:peptide/nickel transport system substrate-binding protein